MRVLLGLLGLLALLDAGLRKRPFRWGLYDIEDDSDIILEGRTSKIFEAVIGIALIAGAILGHGSE